MAEEIKKPVDGEGTPNPSDDQGSDGGEKTFTQEELDKVIQARLDREKKDSEKRIKEMIETEKKAWEKQSKMTQEEREKEILAQKAKENEERERNLTIRENKADAIEKLGELGIPNPKEVSEFLVDLDIEKQTQNIEAFNVLITSLVEKKVADQLKGETPKAIGDTPSNSEKKILTRLG